MSSALPAQAQAQGQSQQILAFDIGIKNLAWCCINAEAGKVQILGWDNYNLLTDSSNVEPTTGKQTCCSCKAKGTYQDSKQTLYCVRHCPGTTPALRDLSGNLLKTIPKVDACRTLLEPYGLPKLPTKKAQVLEELGKRFCLPYKAPKVPSAPDANLSALHDSLRKLVGVNKELWSKCSVICLENQPAFKNPTMKSVQMLLFATIRDTLLSYRSSCPPIKLVHAGKKVQVDAKGDEGYKDRKAASETRIQTFLNGDKCLNATEWKSRFQSAAKKSDLADALAMCLDKVSA